MFDLDCLFWRFDADLHILFGMDDCCDGNGSFGPWVIVAYPHSATLVTLWMTSHWVVCLDKFILPVVELNTVLVKSYVILQWGMTHLLWLHFGWPTFGSLWFCNEAWHTLPMDYSLSWLCNQAWHILPSICLSFKQTCIDSVHRIHQCSWLVDTWCKYSLDCGVNTLA